MQFSRRLIAASILLLAFCGQALGVGSIQLSLSQQFDSQGRPLSGGLLYFFVAGTTTPQNAFQDTALTIPYPNPIVLDASGRVPSFYLADGLIKIRLSTGAGVTVIAADNLLVIGASSGGGGGGSIDVTSVLATGDMKTRYGTGTLSGFVRANGRTIGSAVSGATERANADAQALFEYLWTTDANLAVSGGRGGSANADWVANKTIALPDMRGRHVAGMDDMGSTAASRLTLAGSGFTATVLGAAGGTETKTLTSVNQLPLHTHPISGVGISASGTTAIENASHQHVGTTGIESVDHTHSFTAVLSTFANAAAGGGASPTGAAGSTTSGVSANHTHSFTTGVNLSNHVHTVTVTGATPASATDGVGSSAAFGVVNPAMVMTFYMKL